MRVIYLFFFIFLGSGALFAYRVVPRPGETSTQGQERVFHEFVSELKYLRLDPEKIFAGATGKAPVFVLGDQVLKSELRIRLSREEKEFFLHSFLPAEDIE